MAYFEDLTPYTYGRNFDGPDFGPRPVLNVGWLDASHSVPTDPPSPELVARLDALVKTSLVNLYRGWHTCHVCSSAHGNGEIRVLGYDGIVYVAPALIAHYVSAHHYDPPSAFVAAVFADVTDGTGPSPADAH